MQSFVLVLLAVLTAASCSQDHTQQLASKGAEAYVVRQLETFTRAMSSQVSEQQQCLGWRSSILQAAERWKANAGSAGARYEIIQIRDAAKAAGCVISG